MASSAAPSKASIEPAVHTNSTVRNNAESSAAASQDSTRVVVGIMKIGKVRKAVLGGCAFTYTSQSRNVFRWKCEIDNCSATLKTDYIFGTHYYNSGKTHDEQVHMREISRRSGGGPSTPHSAHDGPKRKADTCADKPPETINGDVQVPAKKSKGRHFLVGGVFRKPLQDTPPRKPEDAAGDNSKIDSTKESDAGNLVDSRAAEIRRSPVHSQDPRGSNKPRTSFGPSGDQGAQESEILPPPTPSRADNADAVQYDTDYGDDSDCFLSDDSMNGDVREKHGAAKHEAGDANSRDAKADGKGSLDPAFRKASYEGMRNVRNAADDSTGIPLSMHGLGRSQTVLNINPETGDLREKQLREELLLQECSLVKARADLVAKLLKNEDLRTKLLKRELEFNMANNKTSERAAFRGLSRT